jgi:hypothetical protein
MSVRLFPVVEPVLKFVDCPEAGGGSHKMAYWEWFNNNTGNNNNNSSSISNSNVKTVVCVHGLTRNGRDFDVVASRLFHEGKKKRKNKPKEQKTTTHFSLIIM